MIQIFEGTCSVCGAPLRMEYNPTEGVVDTWVDNDGSWGTWIRHIENKKINEMCFMVSSKVKFVREE